MKRNVTLKLQAFKAQVAVLPLPRRDYWNAVLRGLRARAGRVVVGAPPSAEPMEWDLAVANELDRAYTAVSDEATRVRREGIAATRDATEQIGWGLWPLALVAVAVLVAYGDAKRGRK